MVKHVLEGRRGEYSFLSQEYMSLNVLHIQALFE